MLPDRYDPTSITTTNRIRIIVSSVIFALICLYFANSTICFSSIPFRHTMQENVVFFMTEESGILF